MAPKIGTATFSLVEKERINGRAEHTTAPAFIQLTILENNGSKREEIMLNLFPFGASYLSENLELPMGSYELTQFVVFDTSNRAMYATPHAGSELSKYVVDPLPIEFIIGNEETQITPHVLSVEPTDSPQLFGYFSFGFDVVPRVTNLNLEVHYPDTITYDSAYIVFRNPETEIKQKLNLNNSTYVARGVVANIPSGNWNISTSFFSTIRRNYQSLEKSGVVDLDITTAATDLISTANFAFIKDGDDPTSKSIRWTEYYYYQLFLTSASNTPEGFVRLPKDPTNPFIEIRTFRQKWIYAYVDRSFYNSSPDGTSKHYQGGGAFEIYGKYGNTYDKLDVDIIDTTSLAPGILSVSSKLWNLVDCVVLVEGVTTDQELLIYHVWDLRASSGRVGSKSEAANWGKLEMEKRKRLHLH